MRNEYCLRRGTSTSRVTAIALHTRLRNKERDYARECEVRATRSPRGVVVSPLDARLRRILFEKRLHASRLDEKRMVV